MRTLRAGYLVVMAGLMPLIAPQLPAQTTLFDWFNLAAIPVILAVLFYTSRVSFPLAAPAMVILMGSLVSMLNGRAIPVNMLTLAQEIYLYLLMVALCNVMRDPADMTILVVAWMTTAVAQSLLVFWNLSGDIAARATGTFLNPNMTSSYLGISALLCFHPVLKGRPLIRSAVFVVVTIAMLGTKSMSAILSLVTAVLFMIGAHTFYGGHRQRVRVAVAALVLFAVAVAVLPQALNMENFLDRLPRSSSGRLATWKVGIGTFLDNPFGLGVGPGGFVEVGIVTGGQWGVGKRMSLHSDYLAYLVERGIVGFLGLMALIGALAMLLLRGIRTSAGPEQRLWMFALSAMLLFTLVDSLSHEMMHYRHVWSALGLMTAQAGLAAPREPGKRPTAR